MKKNIIQLRQRGMTLFELLIAMAILATLSAIAMVAYTGYIEASRVNAAINQIIVMSLGIDEYQREFGQFPASLTDVGYADLRDPWGNPYEYLNIETTTGLGAVRKDHSLVPLNTDYDLYSKGADGSSASPLTASASQDDVLRANNGSFIGKAENY